MNKLRFLFWILYVFMFSALLAIGVDHIVEGDISGGIVTFAVTWFLKDLVDLVILEQVRK